MNRLLIILATVAAHRKLAGMNQHHRRIVVRTDRGGVRAARRGRPGIGLAWVPAKDVMQRLSQPRQA